MERYLITQSLLSSWAYQFACDGEYADDAKDSFMRSLRREKIEATPAMTNGRDFENEVYLAAANLDRTPHKNWEQGIQAVATVIKGAPVQVKASRDITAAGMNFLVYGVLDALSAGVIYDVKFLNKSMSGAYLPGKYLDSAQHPAYFYIVPEAYKFVYLVSDGKDLYTEEYTRENSRHIGDIITEFIASIDSMGLLPLYKERWRAL